MLKPGDIVPGRVLAERRTVPVPVGMSFKWTDVSVYWLIVGFMEVIRRCHARASARRDAWHVLLLKVGNGCWESVLREVTFTSSIMFENDWRRLL